MSKTSSRERYAQLMEWLTTIKRPAKEVKQPVDNLSRAEYYKMKGLE